jgi:hypothetical protein
VGHHRRTEHETRPRARVVELLRLLYRYQRVLLAVHYKRWTVNIGHPAQVVKLVGYQETEEAHFTSGNMLYGRKRRHKYETTRLKLRSEVRCRTTSE